MLALIRKATGECECIVHSTDGYNLAEFDVVDAPDNPADWRYQGGQWVARPRTAAEDLGDDTRWAALRDATPDQIETWLTNNVQNLADARRVLKVILLGLRALHQRKLL